MPQSQARRQRRHLLKQKAAIIRMYTAWHYGYQLMRWLKLKRMAYRLLKRPRPMYAEYEYRPGLLPRKLKVHSKQSVAIGLLVDVPTTQP